MLTSRQQNQHQSILTAAYEKYGKSLVARAFFKTSDHATSEDLVQDTFAKTWKYIVRGGKIETMRAFLYHVLNHLIVDEYRKRKTASLDAMLEKGFEPSAEDSAHKLFNALDGKSLVNLILRLPFLYQKVIRMRYVQGLSLKEISLITGQTRNAIAVQIHRGLAKLRLLYSPAL